MGLGCGLRVRLVVGAVAVQACLGADEFDCVAVYYEEDIGAEPDCFAAVGGDAETVVAEAVDEAYGPMLYVQYGHPDAQAVEQRCHYRHSLGVCDPRDGIARLNATSTCRVDMAAIMRARARSVWLSPLWERRLAPLLPIQHG